MKIQFSLFIFIFFVLNGCTEKVNGPGHILKNQKPQIVSITANLTNVKTEDIVILSCIVADADGDEVSITWSAQFGIFPNGNKGPTVSWRAPTNPCIDSITITASDGKESVEKNILIHVGIRGNPPPIPLLSYPADNADYLPRILSLIWKRASDATSYTIQVSRDSNFSSPNIVFDMTEIIDTSIYFSSFETSKEYFWRVSSINSFGVSDWSSIRRFKIGSFGQPCTGMSTVYHYGKTYNTIQIGTQCWLKENLDVGTMVPGNQAQSNNQIIEKYCFENSETNCNKYGALYQWAEATQYLTSQGDTARGICPPGWHIPTDNDFLVLEKIVGDEARKIIDTLTCSGVNSTGFTALMSGQLDNGVFRYKDNHTYFWKSRDIDPYKGYAMGLACASSDLIAVLTNKSVGISVRCLRN